MSQFRKIFLYTNTASSNQVAKDNVLFSSDEITKVYLDEKIILCLTFYKQDGTPYVFQANETFEFSMDDNFLHSDTPIMYISHEYFNIPGDWDEVDISQGKISIRLSFNTYTLLNKLGANESMTSFVDVKSFNAGSNSLLLRTQFKIVNVINRTGSTVPTPVEEFWNKTQSDSRYVTINNFNLQSSVPISVASNLMTRSSSVHEIILTNNQELHTINGYHDGYVLLLTHSSSNYSVTLKHAVGNLLLPDEQDVVMEQYRMYMLYYDTNNWKII